MPSSQPLNTFAVPKRFGIGAILAFTTLFAVTLGILKRTDAPPWLFWYAGLLGAAVCVAQMFAARAPRAISVVAGAVSLPVFLLFAIWAGNDWRHISLLEVVVSFPFLVVVGGVVGYLAGALAAGVFLLGSMLEAHMRGELKLFSRADAANDASLADVPYYDADSCAPYLGAAAAQLNSVMNDSPAPPRVKPLGPPVGVPVYNCIALVSPKNEEGIVCVRAANLSDLRTTGATEREALQHLVGAFKIIVAQAVAEGRALPFLAEPHPPRPDEQQRFIAVHL